jgi:hypothetical protein
MDNYVWLVVVVLSISMVIGPIMMFKPSGRDRHLAVLRQQAAVRGLRVRIDRYTKIGHGVKTIAVYSISHPPSDGEQKASRGWRLRRQEMEHGIHFCGCWDWDDSQIQAPKLQHQVLKQYLKTLDESIIGVEGLEQSLGLWWQERDLSINDIEWQLKSLQQALKPEAAGSYQML